MKTEIETRVSNMYTKYIEEYHNNDVCIGDILSSAGIEDMFELYIALKGHIEGDIFRVKMDGVWYEYKPDTYGNVKLEEVAST